MRGVIVFCFVLVGFLGGCSGPSSDKKSADLGENESAVDMHFLGDTKLNVGSSGTLPTHAEAMGLISEDNCISSKRSLADCATQNHGILNHLFNHARSNSLIQLPAGVLPINALTITRNVKVVGSGKNVTILKLNASPSDNTVISIIPNKKRVTVEMSSFTIAFTEPYRHTGLSIRGSYESKISDVLIENPRTGVLVAEANLFLRISDVTVHHPERGLVVGYYGGRDVNVTQSNIDIFVTSFAVHGDYRPASGQDAPICKTGVAIYSGVSGFYGKSLEVARCETGFILDKLPDVTNDFIVPEWIFCTDCIADTSRGSGWVINFARGVTLNGSWSGFSGNYGLYANNVNGLIVNAFKAYNSGGAGLAFDKDVKDLIVSASHIAKNNRNNQCASGIYLASGVKDASLSGNIVSNDSSIGLAWNTQLKCGIEIRDGMNTVVGGANMIRNSKMLNCEPKADFKQICPFDR